MDSAALYLRLSKEDIDKINKGDDSESIINQRLLLADYAIQHNFKIADIYSDDDYSGLYDDRPEFDRLIRDSKLGKFNVVIAKTQSRFTRNMEHMEKYLHHDFPLMGIRFIGAVDGVDTQNAANKKSRQINGLVNEWYCEDLSNNIRAVFQQKMKAGQYLGAFAPYGYLKDPRNKYNFIVDDYAAKVVKKIYNLFLEGYSIKKICNILEDDQVPNPTLYKSQMGLAYKNKKAEQFSNKYGFWSETTVKRILSNETYIGKLIQGTYRKASFKDKKVIPVPRDHWYVVENHHEAIINKKTFENAEKLRARRRVYASNQGKDKKIHIFAGKLRCETCGHTMIKSGGVKGKHGDWYLRCQLSNKSRQKECTSHSICYSTIEDAVRKRIIEVVNTVLNDNDNLSKLEEMFQSERFDTEIVNKKSNLRNINLDIEEYIKSLQILYIDRVKNNVTEDTFFNLKKGFEDKLQRLKEKKKALELAIKKLEQNLSPENDMKNNLNLSKLTNEIVIDFIDYIEIGEKNKETQEQDIIIHWNF